MKGVRGKIIIVFIFLISIVFCLLNVVLNQLTNSATNPASRHLIQPDALVYINIGKEYSVGNTINSARSFTKFGLPSKTNVFIITDKPACFEQALFSSSMSSSSTQFQIIDSNDIVLPSGLPLGYSKLKMLKCLILHLETPKLLKAKNIIYVDSDVRANSPLGFEDQRQISSHPTHSSSFAYSISSSFDSISNSPNSNALGLFHDSAGHFTGFCNNCDVFHTGLIVIRRGVTDNFLDDWCKIIDSDEFASDQEAIDSLLVTSNRNSAKYNAFVLPYKHLLFAKDVLRIGSSSDVALIHYTTLNGWLGYVGNWYYYQWLGLEDVREDDGSKCRQEENVREKSPKGVKGDGSNLAGRIPTGGHADKPVVSLGGPWPELKGKPKDEAVAYITNNFPNLKAMAIPEGAMVTMDVRSDRVRIYYNEEGFVSKTPIIH